MDELINEFISEASGIVADLEKKLLMAENSPGTELLNDIFRGVHTLKGSARMFGFVEIEKITHELENTFDDVRQGKRNLGKDLVSLSLKIMDMVKAILEKRHSKEAYFQLYSQLQYGIAAPSKNEAIEAVNLFQVFYHPSANVYDRGVNPYAVIDEIKELGPAVVIELFRGLSDEEQAAKRQFYTRYEIIVANEKTVDELNDVFLFMDDAEYAIFPVTAAADQIHATLEKNLRAASSGIALTEATLEHRRIEIDKFIASIQNLSNEISSKEPEQKKENAIEQADLATSSTQQFINVKLDRLDDMMKLLSELVTLKAEINFHADVLGNHELSGSVERLDKVINKFKDNAFTMRLVPLQILQVKLQRLVRDVSGKLSKEINLIMEGFETEIDKSIISEIEGPLMHIIQNAIDHGIETPAERIQVGKLPQGTLKIIAFYAGTSVFIQIQDDGRGLDLDKIRQTAIKRGLLRPSDHYSDKEIINLIFQAGLTTAESTSAYSGRGVGMDVVMNKLRQLRGSIEVTTESGLGSAFTLRLPLSLSILDVLRVRVGKVNYLIPHHEIVSCLSERTHAHIIQKQGYNVKFEGRLLPHIDLIERLNDGNTWQENGSEPSIIILHKNDQYLSVEVEEIIGETQLVIKPVDKALQGIEYLAGMAVLGNGELAFLLDSFKLKGNIKATINHGVSAIP